MLKSLTSRAAASRKRLATVKEKGVRRYLAEHGAIDLASIMVGVIIIGIIGGVIAAAVFGVIPWSQDKAASQNLDAVKTAESVQYAQSQDNGASGKYLDGADLGDATKTASKTVLLKPTDTVAINTVGGDWAAISVSPQTGHVYAIKGSDGQVKSFDTAGQTLAQNLTDAGTYTGVTYTWASNKVTGTDVP
jgi:type II secretory pathway pseudopilin PulG